MKKLLKAIFFLITFFTIKTLSFADFEIKMSDGISPFFQANQNISSYSNIPFYELDKNTPDLVDKKALETSKENFKKYIKLLKENWYNSISLDDLNHLISFKKSWIYKDSNIEKRNNIYKNYYKELINIAKNENISVYITTDMQFYTDLMEEKIWKISTNNKKLEDLNKEAFEELFSDLGEISWVIMRIWEWWKAYNSWDYKSKIIYKDPEDVNKLLKEILPILEKNSKKLIFRTWTIWIGEIWDLVVDKKTYDETFSGITSNNLIVSVKQTPGDFFYFESLNPTIWYWNLKQIVEIEVRREYEWWWDFPNYMWDYYKEIYDEIKEKNNVIGVWNWNQTWWWWWWKNILFNFWFNFWNEINFYVVWQILNWKEINLDEILDKYNFSDEQKNVLKDILLSSREIIKKWWYINNYREKEIKIWWIFLPPLNRIWWDRISSSPIILSLIYNSLDSKIKTIEESSYLLWIQKKELEEWWKVKWNSDLDNKIYFTLENRYKIFEILQIFKKSFINYFQTWSKENFSEIDEKIKDYYAFKSDKPYINFDFDEIYNFYSTWEDFSFLYLNLFSFWIFLIFALRYEKINNFYKKRIRHKLIILSILCLSILTLSITPTFFLSEYNFYWIIVRINYIIMPLIILYFLIIIEIINRIYKIKIKLNRTFWKIIYSLSPVVIFLEIIIILSKIFWEQIFWNLFWRWLLNENLGILIIFLFIIYFWIFIFYWFKFSNIWKYFEGLKKKSFIYWTSILFLFVFLFLVYTLDYKKIFVISITNKILPSYFQTAWSDVSEFVR